MSWRVPLLKVEFTDADVEAYLDRLRSGWLTMGPYIDRFEDDLGEFLDAEHVVTVSSGSAGLHLAMLAAGIGPGDEVIVPVTTFVASANAPRYAGGDLVFGDSVGPLAPELDVADVERRITPRTKAVIAVHFMGHAAPTLERLRDLCDAHGLILVEDACQSFGAVTEAERRQVGTIGDLGVLSFNAKAQLPLAEGGAVICKRPELAERVRSLRSHGMTSGTWDRHTGHRATYDVVEIGFNFRLDEPRAALGRARLARLQGEIDARRDVARGYRRAFAGRPEIGLQGRFEDEERSSPYGFVVIFEDGATNSRVRERLAADGIETTRYPILTTLGLFRDYATSLRNADAFGSRHCVLPLFSGMTDDEMSFVVERVLAAV